MIANYLDMRERRGPLGFLISYMVLAAVGLGIGNLIYAVLHSNHHFAGMIVFLSILTGIVCTALFITQAVKRTRDMGRAGILALFAVFMAANVPLFWFFSPKTIFSGPGIIVVVLGVIGLVLLMLPGRAAPAGDHH